MLLTSHGLRWIGKHGSARAMEERSVPNIFDRRQAAAKWSRARSRQRLHDGVSYIVETMADDIVERLDFMRCVPSCARVIGDAGNRMSEFWSRNEADVHRASLGEFDETSTDPLGSFDLIVHLLGLALVNDLPGALIRARGELNDGGLFIAAFPGSGSMPKLRQIVLAADGDRPAARMHPLVDNRAGTALLQRTGFSRQVVDSYPINVSYPSLERLIEDMRDHGLTRSLTSAVPPLDRDWLTRANAAFDDLRGEDGKVTETFEILTLTGWR